MHVRLLQASLDLLTCVPCYEGLTEAGPSHAPLWLADAVLATRMQFLMAMLAPCLSQLPQVRHYEDVGLESMECIVSGSCRQTIAVIGDCNAFLSNHTYITWPRFACPHAALPTALPFSV